MDVNRARWSASHGDGFTLSFRVSDTEKIHESLGKKYTGLSELRDHLWGARIFELEEQERRQLEFWYHLSFSSKITN